VGIFKKFTIYLNNLTNWNYEEFLHDISDMNWLIKKKKNNGVVSYYWIYVVSLYWVNVKNENEQTKNKIK
jgi:hypothetical protein